FDEQLKTGTLKRRMHAIEDQLKQRVPDWPARMVAWEKEVAHNQPEWTLLPIEYVGEHDEHYYTLKDGSILAAGYAPTKHTTTWRATNHLARIGAFRLELLNDPSLPWHGPGR